MPNVTYASAQAFIPEIWALRAFQALRNNMVLANLVTTDSDIGSFVVGDILHIPFPGTFTANAKVANTAVTLQTPSDTDVTVTLNKNYEVSFLIEDIARAMQDQNIMDRYINNAVIPLAEQIENDLFALYASLTNNVAVAGMSLSQLLAATKQLNVQKVTQANRKLVISPGALFKLQTDTATTMANYLAFSQPDAIRNGLFASNLGGFDVYMSQLVPKSTNMFNLAFTPDVFVLAMRALPETDNPGVSQTVFRDPGSNLTFRQTVAYIPSQLGLQVTLDVLYGVAVLRNAAGCQVITTGADN
jgi:hypothetical protein